ncbi:MAG TPA: NAD(P)/FAD-dependent oxidoreductase [Ktedonobacterales bacterium]|nr:NAD(P)/FAD-dependent oxidoreductase [Ktedonobacterales bacterium]
MSNQFDATHPRVVIVGAGFGGLQAARALRKAPTQVIVIDRRNHHLFQPLLYQVATADLSPADISIPIRAALRRQRNTEVLLAEVTGVDVEGRRVLLGERSVSYDYLVLATGAQHSYFGHDDWAPYAPGLKSNTDATAIRREILLAFEAAEIETNPEKRQALLTFVIVGGGPTGVELAGAIAGLARKSIVRDFRHIDSSASRILLVEAGPRLLAAFPETLARKAQRELERHGVEVLTNAPVEQVDADGVVIAGKRVAAQTVIWAAGVKASPAGKWLGAETDRAGRVIVGPDLTVPGHPEIFVLGDTASATQDGKPLPGVAPVAMQQGRYVARAIRRRLAGKKESKPFHYRDKGNLATVGRSYAITDLGFIKLTGFIAWVTWLVVHIFYLIGFRNRLLVMIQWAWSYLTYQRGARLITEERRQ